MKKIKVLCSITPTNTNVQYADLDATHFAQSAFDNKIDIDSFVLSMNNFSETSSSTTEEIQAWREEATEHYFTLLHDAGLLKWVPSEFQGGSDYDDTETALDDINNNITKKE